MKIRKDIIQNITYCLLISAALFAGCDQNSLDTPVESYQLSPRQAVTWVGSDHDLDASCSGISGLLTPNNDLELKVMGSKVKYHKNNVLSPTAVSFNICDFDTTGNSFAQTIQVFGPDPSLVFLDHADVELSLAAAGLPSNTPDRKKFRIFKLTDSTGTWTLHATVKTDHKKIKYNITQNSTYAVSLDSLGLLPDSSWSVTGNISPTTGGTLSLLNSNLVAPPLAVNSPTTVTFGIIQAMPEGLNNALPRIYEFSPEGTTFSVPITLNVDLSDAGYDEVNDQVITLYYFDEENSEWVRQPNEVGRTGHSFTVQLNHFSRYAFAR